MSAADAVAALKRIAFLLERALEPSFRVQAFRRAAAALERLPEGELQRRAANGTLRELPGIGEVTERTILEALRGEVPVYLRRLEATGARPIAEGAAVFRAALRGDLHAHTDWSDGGSSIREMAEAAVELGHEYLVISDHSPGLVVANGLSPERLARQLDEVEALNAELAPFRILTGIEVDIREDGTLDQSDEQLDRLDVVVASVHSRLRAPAAEMTPRMVAAIANPRMDVLGHCTGRMRTRRRNRPPSEFDAEVVFAACARFDKAVEINSRPERLDPPKRLLRLAVEAGCKVAIDSDAHAPGQLDWLANGCERAAATGVPVESVVNTWPAVRLLAWTRTHRDPPGA